MFQEWIKAHKQFTIYIRSQKNGKADLAQEAESQRVKFWPYHMAYFQKGFEFYIQREHWNSDCPTFDLTKLNLYIHCDLKTTGAVSANLFNITTHAFESAH